MVDSRSTRSHHITAQSLHTPPVDSLTLYLAFVFLLTDCNWPDPCTWQPVVISAVVGAAEPAKHMHQMLRETWFLPGKSRASAAFGPVSCFVTGVSWTQPFATDFVNKHVARVFSTGISLVIMCCVCAMTTLSLSLLHSMTTSSLSFGIQSSGLMQFPGSLPLGSPTSCL